MSSSNHAAEGSRQGPVREDAAEVADLAAKVAALSQKPREPGESQPTAATPRAGHGPLWWSCYIVAWLAIASLIALAALRIFYHDGTYVLTWFNAYTRYVYLPAYVCLLWAAWQRRWVLTAAAAVVITCHLVWLAPNVMPDRRFSVETAPAAADLSRPVRVFFANVRMDNEEHQSLLEEIEQASPDVVVFAEFHRPWYRAMQASPIITPYTYGALARPYSGTVVIMSKLPLTMEKRKWIYGRSVQTVKINLGSQSLRLIALHAPRPMYIHGNNYTGFYEETLPMLTAPQGPLLVLGDFNATEHSRVYRQLQESGLRSVHDVLGRGYATTWPNGQLLVPPIRIDQAFVSPEVECLKIVEGRGVGSDHKPLIVDVCVRARAQ